MYTPANDVLLDFISWPQCLLHVVDACGAQLLSAMLLLQAFVFHKGLKMFRGSVPWLSFLQSIA